MPAPNDTKPANQRTRIPELTVGFRYRKDLIALLDSIAERRGYGDRSSLLKDIVNRELESVFPGCTDEEAG